jgi:hypothetical protein
MLWPRLPHPENLEFQVIEDPTTRGEPRVVLAILGERFVTSQFSTANDIAIEFHRP